MFSKEAIEAVREGVRKGEPVRGPFDVQVLPLNTCNQSCVFCPLHTGSEQDIRAHAPRFLEPRKIMEWSMFARIVDGLAELGEVERVHFTGGEPLMHPRIGDMVAGFKNRFSKAAVGVVSNGILLEQRLDDLIAARLDRLSVSLNAPTDEIYVKLSPSNKPDDFRKVVGGLEKAGALKREKIHKLEISITCVLTRYNFDSVSQMLDIGTRANADSVTFIPLVPFEYEGKLSNNDLKVTEAQFAEFLRNVKKFSTEASEKGIWLGYGGDENDGGMMQPAPDEPETPCYAGFSFIVFWPDGNVRPCCNCEAVTGNILRHSLRQIWHSDAYREFRSGAKSTEILKKLRCSCKECGYSYENQFFDIKKGQ